MRNFMASVALGGLITELKMADVYKVKLQQDLGYTDSVNVV